MQRPSFLAYRNYRYLKAATLLITGALLLYWLTLPEGGEAYGGTGFGYVLGILSAVLVLILGWYGVRKRRPPRVAERRGRRRRQLMYAAPGDAARPRGTDRRAVSAEDHWRHEGNLQGWFSAHVHLGMALVVLATLHSGLQFRWNLHTLTYVLLLLVVGSGLYGIYAYLIYPRQITENLHEGNLDDVLLKIAELDELARRRSLSLPDSVVEVVNRARLHTRIGDTLPTQLSGRQRDCPTDAAIQRLQELGKTLLTGDRPRLMLDLYGVMLEKQRMLAIARREISLKARLQIWLYIHVPLAIALVATLAAHVITVLIYW